jgi:hypothetical protein
MVCGGRRKVQTRKLADHMAFLTNHVFFVPDLYRDDPWVEDGEETVEQWRARVCVERGVTGGQEDGHCVGIVRERWGVE